MHGVSRKPVRFLINPLSFVSSKKKGLAGTLKDSSE